MYPLSGEENSRTRSHFPRFSFQVKFSFVSNQFPFQGNSGIFDQAGKLEFEGTPEQWSAISEIVYMLSLSREQAAEYLQMLSRREQTCRCTAFALSLTEQDLIGAWTWFLNGDAKAIVAGQARSTDADSSKNA